MFEGRRRERPAGGRGGAAPEEYDEYVETDPTGRYGRFDEMLGKGAMKTVYRAFDELNGVEVAWNQAKICDVLRSPEALQRLYSEVHLLSTLNHDSIIRFHASWVDTGKRTFNFITEMFTSGTLREYRQRHRRVDIRAVKKWARQILHGLVYLHGHNPPVIHRDLKCDNIFVNGHLGQVKIGDLGLAAVLRGSQAAHSVIGWNKIPTPCNYVFAPSGKHGTPEFMAPELYDEEYNELVDIYSFGMCVLEMLTGEYPYSECSNPAQIYRKVTSGKLPRAFYRVQDPEARRFIGKCLEHDASKRSPAKELLLDPFLSTDGSDAPATLTGGSCRASCPCTPPEADQGYPQLAEAGAGQSRQGADMTITGKMNSEDDAIILKVQITDRDGRVQNIYFPFDIVSDTPIDVANEMVKELEITDRDPAQIAEVIAQEVSALVPDWRDPAPAEEPQHHSYVYGDEDEHHPFYELSSPTSTQGSLFGCVPPHSAAHYHHDEDCENDDDDDTSSQCSSTYSGKYSYVNYSSGVEQEIEPQQQPHGRDPQTSTSGHRATRFCTEENPQLDHSLVEKLQKQCNLLSESPRGSPPGGRAPDDRRLQRNRSLVDMRSQLLHRVLVEEVNKRLFKTVGSVENIGFQAPGQASSSRGSSRGTGKNLGLTWGR